MTPVETVSLGQHLRELRRRVVWTTLALGVGAGVGYMFQKPLIWLLEHPLHLPLYYSSPSGAFEFVVKTCLVTGIIMALPAALYNAIRYIEPAFGGSRLRRRSIITIVVASTILALVGVVFSYMVVLPLAFQFFAKFSGNGVHALISTHEYLSFVTGCFITFALLFQLPLVLLTFNSIRQFPPGGLTRYRRHVFIGSLTVAVILPFTYDPISQLLLAAPIVALYELSIFAIWMVNLRRSKQMIHAPRVSPAPVNPRSNPHPRQQHRRSAPYYPLGYTLDAKPTAMQSRPLDRQRIVRLG